MAKFKLSDGSVIKLSNELSLDEQLDTIQGLEESIIPVIDKSKNHIKCKSEYYSAVRTRKSIVKRVISVGNTVKQIEICGC